MESGGMKGGNCLFDDKRKEEENVFCCVLLHSKLDDHFYKKLDSMDKGLH